MNDDQGFFTIKKKWRKTFKARKDIQGKESSVKSTRNEWICTSYLQILWKCLKLSELASKCLYAPLLLPPACVQACPEQSSLPQTPKAPSLGPWSQGVPAHLQSVTYRSETLQITERPKTKRPGAEHQEQAKETVGLEWPCSSRFRTWTWDKAENG